MIVDTGACFVPVQQVEFSGYAQQSGYRDFGMTCWHLVLRSVVAQGIASCPAGIPGWERHEGYERLLASATAVWQ